MPSQRRRPSAFTMIELLTVIGIIVVLMAILLPVVSRVRIQAQVANTQQQINQIVGAIERYRAEQGVYPGPISNAAFSTTAGTGGPATDGGSITSTENMVMGICGGLENATIPGPRKTDPDSVGKGAVTHVTDPTRRVRLQVYIDPTPGSMMPLQPWASNGKTGRAGSAGDCNIPEFIDRFQDPRPIIYMRANVGNPGVTATSNTAQYNSSCFNPYLTRSPAKDSQGHPLLPGDFDTATPEPGTTVPAFTTYDAYLMHPTVTNVPRGKDQFILVSAGADNTFGTKDDIFNSGNQ